MQGGLHQESEGLNGCTSPFAQCLGDELLPVHGVNVVIGEDGVKTRCKEIRNSERDNGSNARAPGSLGARFLKDRGIARQAGLLLPVVRPIPVVGNNVEDTSNERDNVAVRSSVTSGGEDIKKVFAFLERVGERG